MTEPNEVDVVIAGGGPVGRALESALSASALSVLRISRESEAGERPIALSHGSRLILERLGFWGSIPNTPIESVHVSHPGFGRTVMRCAELALPALGYVVAYSDLVARLSARSGGVDARLERWEAQPESVRVEYTPREGKACALRARLLVLADGGQLGEAERVREYGQHAVVCSVAAERVARGVAWERFTPDGPLALLPVGDRNAVVWSTSRAKAEALIACSDQNFLERLHAAFGGRMGAFHSATQRSSFPLSLRRAADPGDRVVAVGNASQTLHPVAGQGLNLGLRDTWELAQMLLDVPKGEIGSSGFIASYLRRRRVDRVASVGFTDLLVRTFSNSNLALSALRGAGLAALDTQPWARRFLAERMIFGARAFP